MKLTRHLQRTAIATLGMALASAGVIGVGSAAQADDARADITAISIQDSVLQFGGNNYLPGAISLVPNGVSVSKVTTQVRVNGAVKGVVTFYNGSRSFAYNSAWGTGTLQLGPSTLSTSAGDIVDNTLSKVVRVRNGIKGSLYISRRGKKVKFTTNVTVFSPGKQKYVGLRKATIQVKKNGKWKTLKKVKLSKKGKDTYTIKTSTKRYYRLYVKKTNSVQGGKTKKIGKI